LYDPHHLDKVTTVHLLDDSRYFYVACNQQQMNVPPGVFRGNPGNGQPILIHGSGLRSLSVNGAVYCFKKTDGSLNWYNIENDQAMLLDQFSDLPMVIFASRFKSSGGNRNVGVQSGCVRAVEKLTGKLVYSNENVSNNAFFHTLLVDPRAGRIDFIGNQLKVNFQLDGNSASGPKPKVNPTEGGATLSRPGASVTQMEKH